MITLLLEDIPTISREDFADLFFDFTPLPFDFNSDFDLLPVPPIPDKIGVGAPISSGVCQEKPPACEAGGFCG